MEFQEYPKALYRQGVYTEVRDEAEEDAQRAEGFTDWHTDHEGQQEGDDGTGAEPLDRDALKARAAELGITHAPNISTGKLAALVAAA